MREATEQSKDHLTAYDARTARGMLDHAIWLAARGEDEKAETSAAKAPEVTIETIHRSQESVHPLEHKPVGSSSY